MNTARTFPKLRCRKNLGSRIAVAAALALAVAGWARADAPSGLVYTPISPCILVRTAGSPAGKLEANETREFLARGETNLSAQGGSISGCGIPDEAAVISVTIRVASAAGAGQLKVWASDQDEPLTALVDYSPGGAGISLPALVSLCSAKSCATDFDVKAVRNGAHVRIDVVGYFAPGAAGAAGPAGPPGPTGPQGPPGPAGPVLPFNGSVQFGGSAFQVSNIGTGANGGSAIEGHTTTAASGVYGASDNGAGLGVKGRAGAGSSIAVGNHIGVLGDSDSGQGVLGESASGNGVHGLSVSHSGVYGHSSQGPGITGESDLNEGIHGHTVSQNGLAAISGVNEGSGAAGVGPGIGPGGPGVLGTSDGTGVLGLSTSSGYYGMAGLVGVNLGSGSGVFGKTQLQSGYAPGAAGVWGDSNSFFGVLGTSNTADGVLGLSTAGSGVEGRSFSFDGVHGNSSSASGVAGTSTAGAGVWGESGGFDGVHGHTSAQNAAGVAGFSDQFGPGVFGRGFFGNGIFGTTSGGAGVWGESAGGDGVHGHTSHDNNAASGVAGLGDGAAYGVYGSSADGDGVFGHSNTGYAMAADGPATQARNQGGWVKAMALIDDGGAGTIIRCFNSQLPAPQASAPPCGFHLSIEPGFTASGPWVDGRPWIASLDMGFEVDDRFIVVTPLQIQNSGTPTVAQVLSMGGNGVSVSTWDSAGNGIEAQFFIVVY